ncbi:uncharacterized protein BDZ99DRAFT_504156 [Mytilinidion resinicola]|uniref:Integral membrane protein n=1 Tax=Mytilinidion resinicola TaxID=574789 RepID=A0A6A6Y031_9PEZI|nr:uncharacterized protein BDZ99DRAFT_504156 [Mytilinidion resinicola]KAF2802161.1 hypothetical protein BDZ99DRAFT_504156 [Mytilinidion resinicola]
MYPPHKDASQRHFYRDPGSIFFDETRAYVRWYSAFREHQATAYITEVEAQGALLGESADDMGFAKARYNASMCATFLTVRRDVQKQYLETSLGSIFAGLTYAERRDVNIQIFFANTDPAQHSTYNKPWLRHLVDRVYSYTDMLPVEELPSTRALETAGKNILSKAPLDYTHALQQCYDTTTSPYIALFEDDIIAADGWFAHSLWAARETTRQTVQEGKPGKWVYIRTFNQERSTGWSSKRIGGHHELPISLAIGVTLDLILWILRSRTRLHVDRSSAFVISFIAIPAFVVLFFQSGKASLLPPAPGVRPESFGCCNQALVFNREHIPGLVEHMRQWAEKGMHDMLIRDWAWAQGLQRYSAYPMLAQHVGARSSIQRSAGESRKVWSMAFEGLDPRRLAREHAEVVRGLYG